MTETSLLTFDASAEHHNQRVTCVASYPLTTGGSKQSKATTKPLDVQCETLNLCSVSELERLFASRVVQDK